ncbi:HalOD1 output domain-containing protein [Halopiger thermotolerans]
MPLPADSSTSGDSVPPSQAIVAAVADHEGVDVTEIEPPAYDPLYTVVNPEALDELFDLPSAGPARVHLEYEGYAITVHSDGRVDVSDPSADESVGRPVED